MCGKRFHSRSPGGLERMFIKAGVSDIKEGLRVEEAGREPGGCSALAP